MARPSSTLWSGRAPTPAGTGWSGPTIWPYGGDSTGIERFASLDRAGEDLGLDRGIEGFGFEGQILYRKLDTATALPIPDTDTAADWAQATDDPINGKKVQYPGWDLERYFIPPAFAEPATLTYAVAPDHIYETVLAEINQATTSILYEGYTFKNAHLADAIVARLDGQSGHDRQHLARGRAGGRHRRPGKVDLPADRERRGQVYFMHTDDAADVHDRYNYQHGKWMIIDGETLLTGSENLNYSSMPADDKVRRHRGQPRACG